MHKSNTTTYRDAGVDIDAGNQLVERIKPLAKSCSRPEVLDDIGSFGGLFSLAKHKFADPVLVAGTDGVGTKLHLAFELDAHDHIGYDLVAMCANDLIVCGAEPLFFLDYFATGKLNIDTAERVVASIAKACQASGMALLGGETAEMPGMYAENHYDLAGFCVGIADKKNLLTGDDIKPGDQIIGIASSGPHANGYSLIRKIIQDNEFPLTTEIDGSTLAEILMTPTRIYVKSCLELIAKVPVKALAHITGGGLLENIPRIMPAHTRAVIQANTWDRPAIFDWLKEQGNIPDNDWWRTFNCGIGMVVITSPDQTQAALNSLSQLGETAYVIGEITPSDNEKPNVRIC